MVGRQEISRFLSTWLALASLDVQMSADKTPWRKSRWESLVADAVEEKFTFPARDNKNQRNLTVRSDGEKS